MINYKSDRDKVFEFLRGMGLTELELGRILKRDKDDAYRLGEEYAITRDDIVCGTPNTKYLRKILDDHRRLFHGDSRVTIARIEHELDEIECAKYL